jgi:hypothetical protein
MTHPNKPLAIHKEAAMLSLMNEDQVAVLELVADERDARPLPLPE